MTEEKDKPLFKLNIDENFHIGGDPYASKNSARTMLYIHRCQAREGERIWIEEDDNVFRVTKKGKAK